MFLLISPNIYLQGYKFGTKEVQTAELSAFICHKLF